MTTLLVGLLLATISGLGYLAVNHHDVYQTVKDQIWTVGTCVAGMTLTAAGGYYVAKSAISEHVKDVELFEGVFTSSEIFKFILAVFVIYWVAIFFLVALDLIGSNIKRTKELQQSTYNQGKALPCSPSPAVLAKPSDSNTQTARASL